ncbi:ACT domain-containing protein [Geopyxis carbonaria]|nr:ACT domain-containing protein [Geopyxis carbonaria]
MSASIQFLVSVPAPPPAPVPNHTLHNVFSSSSNSASSLRFNPSSPSPNFSCDSRSSSSSSWSRTSSWAQSSAVAGITLPPPSGCTSISSVSYPVTAATGIECLHTSVRFLQDCRLSLIHIPLHLYPHFVQAILSLILPESAAKDENSLNNFDDDFDHSSSEGSVATDFINISVTPVECSVVCSKEASSRFFLPIINELASDIQHDVSISDEEFVAIQVDGEGLDAGQRVLDLTSPLALAGISIFFITTYFSDYILVPSKSRSNVTKALQRRGFIFEKYSDSFVTTPSHHRNSSSTSSFNIPPPPTPPSTTTLSDLENSTFNTLRKRNVVPQVNEMIKLVQCAGRRSSRKGNSDDGNLKLGLVKCLVSQPRFMSVTLTDAEPASLLLEKEMLPMFDTDTDILLGSKEDVLIPIVLDLRGLPVESTGIVCGVAGRLVGSTTGGILDGDQAVEMSYLSTARAGTVMVAENDILRAVNALNL